MSPKEHVCTLQRMHVVFILFGRDGGHLLSPEQACLSLKRQLTSRNN
jgi:hypothetical protein